LLHGSTRNREIKKPGNFSAMAWCILIDPELVQYEHLTAVETPVGVRRPRCRCRLPKTLQRRLMLSQSGLHITSLTR